MTVSCTIGFLNVCSMWWIDFVSLPSPTLFFDFLLMDSELSERDKYRAIMNFFAESGDSEDDFIEENNNI
uniref:Uncharacterized protein n=1 Tax=Romanomermis culicivorax TaxID=13658 RepID=A0A915KXI0_ROMCU